MQKPKKFQFTQTGEDNDYDPFYTFHKDTCTIF